MEEIEIEFEQDKVLSVGRGRHGRIINIRANLFGR